MDFWAIVLLCAFLFGIMGWGMTLYFYIVYWWCDWQEGNPINWGFDTVTLVTVPFAYLFVIIEIALLYGR